MTTLASAPSAVRTYGTWPQQQDVTAGPGAVAALADEVRRRDASRVFLLTTPSLTREASLLSAVRSAIGPTLVGEFDGCRAHNPRPAVLAAAAAARAVAPDLLVSFGGSTVTDTAKAASFAIAHGIEEPAGFDAADLGTRAADPEVRVALLPQVAIPTTLSGAEYSAAAGVTNPETHVKRVYHQPGLAPVAVLLDPDVTAATPQRLWCSTGVKSMSDAIEMLCSPSSHPFVKVLTRAAVATFFDALPRSFDDDPVLRAQARSACLHATWMSASSLANTTSRLGIGTSVRHQLGAMGVGHGEATCIMLPHLLAYNWPALGDERADIATALGLDPHAADARKVRDRVGAFIAELGLPAALRDVGVAADDIPGLAQRMHADPSTQSNPRRTSVNDIEDLLGDAY